jgi:hypothetical protein
MNQEEEIKNLKEYVSTTFDEIFEEEIKNLKEYIVAMQSKINELKEKQNEHTKILSYLAKAQEMEVERLTKLAKVVKEVEQR